MVLAHGMISPRVMVSGVRGPGSGSGVECPGSAVRGWGSEVGGPGSGFWGSSGSGIRAAGLEVGAQRAPRLLVYHNSAFL